MASTIENPSAGEAVYRPPSIADYGSIEELTADFDVNFVGAVAKLVTMAVASGPMGGGDAPPAEVAAPSDSPLISGGEAPPGTDGSSIPDGRTPDSATLGDGPSSGDGESRTGGVQESGGGESRGDGAGGIREEVAGGAGLPFTGYAAWAVAALGAAMTTSGVVVRDLLRRRK